MFLSHRWRIAVVSCLLVGGPLSQTVSAEQNRAPRPLPDHAVGVRFGGAPSTIAEYEQWLGAQVEVVTLFGGRGDDRAVIDNVRSKLAAFAGTRYRLLFSLRLVRPGETLADTANGTMDDQVRAIAAAMVAAGRGDDIIRPGWEHNSALHPWSALDDPVLYASAFRRVVQVMRSVPGAEHLKFDWNYACNGPALDLRAYPGDDYVDVIGVDCYDRTLFRQYLDPIDRFDFFYNRPFGFKWLSEFSQEHGKPIGIAEWGVSSRHLEGAEHDNPVYIHRLLSWIAANDVAYFNYFERDVGIRHRLMTGQYPKSAARYRYMIQEWLPDRLSS